IIAHIEMLDAQAVDQYLTDELVGTELAQAAIESQAQHPVYALLFQQRQLVAQAGKTRRRALGGEVFPGLGFEDHHTSGQPKALGVTTQAFENRLMAGMYTVEITNCRHAPTMMGAQIVQAADQFHSARYRQMGQSRKVYRLRGYGVIGVGGLTTLGRAAHAISAAMPRSDRASTGTARAAAQFCRRRDLAAMALQDAYPLPYLRK